MALEIAPNSDPPNVIVTADHRGNVHENDENDQLRMIMQLIFMRA